MHNQSSTDRSVLMLSIVPFNDPLISIPTPPQEPSVLTKIRLAEKQPADVHTAQTY